MKLEPMSSSPAYLKAGFLGFAGSGKTYTATELALGVREFFELEGPLAFFDTENGADYVRARIEAETGQPLLGIKGRNIDQAIEFINACVQQGVSAAIVDSVTHLWTHLIEAYLKSRNDFYKRKGWNKRQTGLEFQDWGPVKRRWAPFADLVTNAPLHLIIAGRAGFTYDHELDDQGKKQLVKTGIKMKTESEFGFEPSLIVEMSREEDFKDRTQVRRALVTKDRFSVIDGATAVNPEFSFFEPHVRLLVPGSHKPVDTDGPDFELDDEGGDDGWANEKRQREIYCEEIKGELTAAYPSQSAADKSAKSDLVYTHLNTRSWKKVEGMKSHQLYAGLLAIRQAINPEPEEPEDELPDLRPDAEDGPPPIDQDPEEVAP